MTLALAYRLKKENDFNKVFQEGKTIRGDFLFIKFLRNDLKRPRFGIVVSKKISNKSTERNYIKRKISEAVKTINYKKLSVDFVIVANQSIVNKSFQEIKREIERALNMIIRQH